MRPRGTCCNWICVHIVLGIWILFNPLVYPHQRTPAFKLADGDLFNCTPIGNLVEKLPTRTTTSWRGAPTMLPVDHYLANLSMDIPTVHSVRIRQATQLIVTEQQTCPPGTVPIRSPRPLEKAIMSHKYAAVYMVGPLRGSQGRLSIWRPYVQEKDFSLAQVWVTSYDDENRLHALEAGWHIWQDYYGDSKPRLFVYWTNNTYREGFCCHNLDCPGFIQVSNKWLLGGSFTNVSRGKNPLYDYEIKIQIFKDAGTGDWWLQLNDENVGYWPQTLFGLGAFSDSSVITIGWGGETLHKRGHSTNTQMGNGNHPDFSETRRVAYMRNLRVVNHEYRLDDPATISAYMYTKSTYKKCYDIIVHDQSSGAGKNQSLGYDERSTWGTYAYFGGPGLNAECALV